jgi:hypothetical protein
LLAWLQAVGGTAGSAGAASAGGAGAGAGAGAVPVPQRTISSTTTTQAKPSAFSREGWLDKKGYLNSSWKV